MSSNRPCTCARKPRFSSAKGRPDAKAALVSVGGWAEEGNRLLCGPAHIRPGSTSQLNELKLPPVSSETKLMCITVDYLARRACKPSRCVVAGLEDSLRVWLYRTGHFFSRSICLKWRCSCDLTRMQPTRFPLLRVKLHNLGPACEASQPWRHAAGAPGAARATL